MRKFHFNERVHFETDGNFWIVYPEILNIEDFKEIYDKDKSKKKEESSKIMWALHLIMQPESMWFNIPNKEILVVRDFLKKDEKKIKISNYKEYDLYKEIVLTQAERSLFEWTEMMRKRDHYLKNMEYNLDNMDQLDKAYSTTSKLLHEYNKIITLYSEEKSKVSGSKAESLTDSGEI